MDRPTSVEILEGSDGASSFPPPQRMRYHITIPTTRTTSDSGGCFARPYTEYAIRVEAPFGTWIVWHRYRTFLRFFISLYTHQSPLRLTLPPFPSKVWFFPREEKVVELRRRVFQEVFRRLCLNDAFLESEELVTFLQISKHCSLFLVTAKEWYTRLSHTVDQLRQLEIDNKKLRESLIKERALRSQLRHEFSLLENMLRGFFGTGGLIPPEQGEAIGGVVETILQQLRFRDSISSASPLPWNEESTQRLSRPLDGRLCIQG
eukprot:TRINITY_DN1262_c0_g1_i2.p2 TRINITY_DN1262_c0_g1~~TRINITY_DN1262_c0_g1_i2.p2  ORF type:complete len:262 (+),score=34.51 TRINITY_DN1262_c0_g1_i2:101-886(+)